MTWWIWQWLTTAGDNFNVVDKGKVYRSAALSADALRAKVKEYGIRTVLDLRIQREGSPPDIAGVTMRHAALDDHGDVNVPLVEECAKLLADPSAQPVLVHCAGGRHRTGVVVAFYRVRFCGWAPERARKEANDYGFYAQGHEAWAEYLENLR